MFETPIQTSIKNEETKESEAIEVDVLLKRIQETLRDSMRD